MQRQHIRILILAIIILVIISLILMLAERQMEALDQQMPVVGSALPPTIDSTTTTPKSKYNEITRYSYPSGSPVYPCYSQGSKCWHQYHNT